MKLWRITFLFWLSPMLPLYAQVQSEPVPAQQAAPDAMQQQPGPPMGAPPNFRPPIKDELKPIGLNNKIGLSLGVGFPNGLGTVGSVVYAFSDNYYLDYTYAYSTLAGAPAHPDAVIQSHMVHFKDVIDSSGSLGVQFYASGGLGYRSINTSHGFFDFPRHHYRHHENKPEGPTYGRYQDIGAEWPGRHLSFDLSWIGFFVTLYQIQNKVYGEDVTARRISRRERLQSETFSSSLNNFLVFRLTYFI